MVKCKGYQKNITPFPEKRPEGHSGQNGTARYIVTDFLENFKISKYLKLHA